MRQTIEILTPEALPLARRPDRWGEILSMTHEPMAVSIPDETCKQGFTATVRRRWVDDVAVMASTSGPCSGVRTRKDASSSGEFVQVVLILSGSERISGAGLDRIFGPGDFLIADCTIPMKFTIPEGLTKRTMLVPRHALELAGGRRWTGNTVLANRNAPAVQLLDSYLAALTSLSAELTAAATVAARNATIELLLGVIGMTAPDSASMSMRELLWLQVDRWIDANLGDELSPSAAAAAHNVSVRTLHRMYSDANTTFGAEVRNRRLSRARSDLLATPDSVQRIAARWGFSDASHFYRVFKEAYGASPSECRAAERQRDLARTDE